MRVLYLRGASPVILIMRPFSQIVGLASSTQYTVRERGRRVRVGELKICCIIEA
jgi:hypothetical protein